MIAFFMIALFYDCFSRLGRLTSSSCRRKSRQSLPATGSSSPTRARRLSSTCATRSSATQTTRAPPPARTATARPCALTGSLAVHTLLSHKGYWVYIFNPIQNIGRMTKPSHLALIRTFSMPFIFFWNDAQITCFKMCSACGVNCCILDSRRVLGSAPKVLGPKHISNPDFAPF